LSVVTARGGKELTQSGCRTICGADAIDGNRPFAAMNQRSAVPDLEQAAVGIAPRGLESMIAHPVDVSRHQ
jgi:hypothetical protein